MANESIIVFIEETPFEPSLVEES
jgi:hypothetical protein